MPQQRHQLTLLHPSRQPPRTESPRTTSTQTAAEILTAAPARPPIRSLYIHTPFCVHKCHYCDFYSIVDTQDREQAFVDRLIAELRFLAPHADPAIQRPALDTVFVGGGTPSLLRVDLWRRLLGALHELFDLSAMISRGVRAQVAQPLLLGEFTVECNPESATPDLLAVLRSGGVNRVSMGAQSFDPRHLKTLERTHNPENVARALESARAAGIPRQSIDLIFGIPGQTLAEWERDLDRAIALGTTHLSCYGLTYEPGTAMTARLGVGQFEPIDDDLEADMFELTLSRLAAAGLARYEISNYARPGHESLHNLAYWRQHQWLAAGPSASGHVYAGAHMRDGGWRWKNVPRLGDYLAADAATPGENEDDRNTGICGASPVIDVESPDPRRALRERLLMGLRLAEGIDAAAFLADLDAVAPDAAGLVVTAAQRLEGEGLLQLEGLVFPNGAARWTLTPRGMMLCDSVVGALSEPLCE
ncbi:MAG: radical SAM family heme chaperone HemW [Phycisphaerales bacterium]|nr:radical SAM family heme chaperone HemW [Phycisphaerales bacterium]